jgi:hypothetical protein
MSSTSVSAAARLDAAAVKRQVVCVLLLATTL